MRLSEAAIVGVVMGGLYGLTLIAAADALSLASFILFKNPYLIPFGTASIVMLIAFITLFSYPYWIVRAEDALFRLAEDIQTEDEEIEKDLEEE